MASIRHLKTSQVERDGQQRRVAQVRAALDAAGVPHYRNDSHIVPVMVGNAKLCKLVSDRLLDQYGIYVQPINYPTVPRGTERASHHAVAAAQRCRHRASGGVAVGGLGRAQPAAGGVKPYGSPCLTA